MNGKLQTKTISKALVNRNFLTGIAEFTLLMGLGVLAVTLHAYLRYPLHLPGHHGMEFMALLFFGYKMSRFKASTTLFSLGAGLFLLFPFLGIKDLFAPIVYMMPGIVIYISTSLFRNHEKHFLILTLIGGLAYASIPLTRILIMFFTDYPYKSIITTGPLYVFASFFVFGIIGSAFTLGIFKAIRK